MTQSSDVIGAGRYVALLRAPHVGALLGWGMVARLPLGMTPLALLLVVRGQGGSYAAAGAVAAAYAIALGAGSPIAGRQVDRHGQAHVPVPRAIVHPCLLAAVGALALAGVPTIALAVAAAAAGATSPPVYCVGCRRSSGRRDVPSRRLLGPDAAAVPRAHGASRDRIRA